MSLSSHAEISPWRAVWRDRVLGDFTQFHFSWAGFFRWTGIVLAAFLIAAIVTLYFLDWNQMRGPIGNYASWRYGRTVRIDGDLKVNLFRWQPHVAVGGVFIGNPAWVGDSQAARIGHADLEFRLWPALFGHLILPLVSLNQPEILLVRRADGVTNWDRPGNRPGNHQGWTIPPIQHLLVKDGHAEIDDKVRRLKFVGRLSSEENAGGGFRLDGDGTLNGNKFLADLQGGPLIHVDESKPYHFTADIRSGETHAVMDGQMTHPFHLGQFTANVTATGKTLSELYDLTGVALPGTPPYHLSGALTRDGAFYSLTDLAGMVGGSDLRGTLTLDVSGDVSGDVSRDASGALPVLKGHLTSRVLDFDDLGAMFRGGKTAAQTGDLLLPDVALHTERLRQINGEVDYDADAIRSRDFPLRGLTTHISVENGVLTLKPLAFGFTEGKLSGALVIDARKAVPLTKVDARITDIHIEHFIKSADKPLSGLVEARAQLSGSGNSVHKVASTANGVFTAVVPQGQMRKSLAEWLGVNVLSGLGLTLSGDTSNTNLRCAVMNFSAQNGVLAAQQMVLDTGPTRLDGKGSINLQDETLDLTLQGKPKHFQFVHLNAPVRLSGKLAHPTLGIDAKPAIAQGAIGAGLGLINPLASILAFIDPGLAKDANCAAILADARAQGAPVKAQAVKDAAQAPKK